MRWPIALLLGLLVVAGVAAVLIPTPGLKPTAESEPTAPPLPPLSPPHQFVDAGEKEGRGEDGAETDGDPALLTLDWEDLIPADWQPELLFAEYDLDSLEDDDELAIELLDKLMEVWAAAPVVEELYGRRVRLPGFAVPLDGEPGTASEFLLVPYFGACIHVPPPPANQTVYIKAAAVGGFKLELFDTVWITGTMRAESFSAELAQAGYTIYADQVEPYQDDSVLILE